MEGWRLSKPLQICIFLVIFSTFVCGSPLFDSGSSSCVVNSTWLYRLPWTVIPSHYDLYLQPDVINYKTIVGAVNISVTVIVSTSCIVVNTDKLNFTSVKLLSSSGSLSPSSWTSNALLQQTVISFASPLSQGAYQLAIEYTGHINQKNATGLFKSAGDFPTDSSNSFNASLVMLATQFEMMYFRMAFPGWDEPQFKATFSATVSLPADQPQLTALFNTPMVSDTILADNQTRIVQFSTTPHPMANYLVAFAIGQFDFLQGESNGLTFRVYTPPGKSSMAEFALNTTMAAIQYYGNLWQFPFSFPKVDSIAVPAIIEDAMENWGLLTYDPNFLLVDENTPLEQRQLVCQVITHELAHQWFGDTVTMPWWSQFFLNEGFARYYQYVSVQYLHPEYQMWTVPPGINFLEFAYSAIEQDATGMFEAAVIVPDQAYSGNPFETDQFEMGTQEGLAYGKGAAVLRMMATHMGDTAWNAALASHLQKRQYTNPTLEMLIEDLGNDRYAQAFGDWLTRPGVPLVSIRMSDEFHVLNIEQQPISPFLPQNQTWWVPLEIQYRYNYSSLPLFSLTADMFTPGLSVVLPDLDSYGISFLVANPNYTLFAVIQYDDAIWDLIFRNLHTEFDSPHVLQLAQQTFLLAQMSHASLSLPLKLSALLSTQIDSAEVWNYVVSHWLAVSRSLLDTHFFNELSAQLVNEVFDDLALWLGWSAQNASSLRQQALYGAVFFGSSSVIEQAIQQYDAVHQNASALPWDATQAVLYAIAQKYGSGALSELQQIYSTSPAGSPLQQAALNALMALPDAADCQAALDLLKQSLNDEDLLSAASSMLTQSVTCRDVAWSSIASEIAPSIWKKQGAEGTDSIITAISGIFWQENDVARLQAFAHQNLQYFLQDQLTNSADLALLVPLTSNNTCCQPQ